MKKLTLRFFSVFLFISWAWGIDFRSDNLVTVDAPVWETVAAAGSDITLSAPVDGDVFVAGNTITLSSQISEDVWVAGNIITSTATISDDLRAAGQVVNIWGAVVWDVMIWSNTATLSATIWWDVYIWSNLVTINGPISWDAKIGAGTLTLNSTIWGDMRFEWDVLNIWSGASIAGDLEIVPDAQIPVNLSWFVWGTIINIDWLEKKFDMGDNNKWDWKRSRWWFRFNFFRFVTMAILWSLAMRLMPNYTRRAVGTITKEPGKTFLYGLLALICIPFAAIILVATGVWAPIGWRLLANYIFLWVFLWLFVVVFLADYLVEWWLYRYIGNTLSAKIAVIIVLSFILTALPYFITIILGMFGIGSGWINDMKIIKKNI